MNEKEIAEIRRRYRPEKNNIYTVRGCYVNEKGEIVSKFNQSITLMPESESEKFLSILKKTLSGGLNRNLIDIPFTTQQVVNSEEHKLLMALRNTKLQDEDAADALFGRIIQTVDIEENYLILLAQDTYDVPYRGKDGEDLEDSCSEVFSYFLCSVCPIKQTKPALSYYVHENEFHSRPLDWVVSAPEIGFMFPTFEDRSANIYNALFYTRDTSKAHQPFLQAIFDTGAPMPAATQKDTFSDILHATFADACSLDAVQAVHGHLQEMIETHKQNKEEHPLTIGKTGVKAILQHSGATEAQTALFEEQYTAAFGEDATVSPKNLVDTKKLVLSTGEVTISLPAAQGNLVQTRVIDGAKYILVRVEGEAAADGVPIVIQ